MAFVLCPWCFFVGGWFYRTKALETNDCFDERLTFVRLRKGCHRNKILNMLLVLFAGGAPKYEVMVAKTSRLEDAGPGDISKPAMNANRRKGELQSLPQNDSVECYHQNL